MLSADGRLAIPPAIAELTDDGALSIPDLAVVREIVIEGVRFSAPLLKQMIEFRSWSGPYWIRRDGESMRINTILPEEKP